MAQRSKAFHLEVILDNGTRLETRFTQVLEEGQLPAARFYLGYSSDTTLQQDLPWIAVGEIAYLPDEVVAVKITPADEGASDGEDEIVKLRSVKQRAASS